MSETIDEYIARTNEIFNQSSTKSNNTKKNSIIQEKQLVDSTGKRNNKKNNKRKQKDAKLLNYNTFEQLASLCKRTLILYTEGVYIKPPQTHTCNKKKQKTVGKKVVQEPSNKRSKTMFGSGRIGVSCESYGIKNCSCCAPSNDEDVLLRRLILKLQRNGLSIKHPDDYIDLTSTSVSGGQASTSKKLDSSEIIYIADTTTSPNNSLNIISDEVISLDDDDDDDDDSGAKNFANVENITDYINLVTTDYDEDEMRKNEEIINTEIQTDVIMDNNETASNFANVENITDYINLVTKDYDEDAMSINEEELAEVIHAADLKTLPAVLKITPVTATKSVPKQDVVSNKENIPNINNNFKAISSNSTAPELCCPICFENLIKKETMSTICGHLFCAECIKEAIKITRSCPTCRSNLTLKSIHPIYLG